MENGYGYHWKGVVLVHNTQSNNSQSNVARFMHKLCLSLHAHEQIGGDTSHHIKRLKDFTE